MVRMPELPVLSRDPVCPAALRIAGAMGSQQGVVCRAMQLDIGRDDGTELDMSAGQFGYLQRDASGGVYLNLKSDPGTVVGFCHGDAVPVLSDADGQSRRSYTYCPVWQAEKDRIAGARDRLVEEQQPEPVSMGVSSLDAPDPVGQARRDLDLLAPPAVADA